jgi:hypothetical protein
MRWDGNDPENQIIVDNRSVSGSQSLKLECAPGWTAAANVRLSLTPPIIYCEGYVMVDQTEYGPSIGFNNPDIGTWGTGFANVRVLKTCEANTWYHLKLRYDSYRDVGTIWVDGVLKYKDKPCRKNGEYSVFAMSTMHYTISSKVWYDDIKVYADSLIMMPYIFFTGLYLELTGDPDSAKVYFNKALGYIDVNPDLQLPQYRFLRLLRYLHYSAGDIDSVLFYKQRTLDWYNQNGYLFLAMYLSNDLGLLYYKNNEVNTAEKYYHQSKRIFKEMKDNNSWYKLDSLNNIVALGTDLIYPLHRWQMKELIWILGKSMYDGLYQINKAKKRIGDAHNYYIAYSNAKDTLNKLQRIHETNELITKSEAEHKLGNQLVIQNFLRESYLRKSKIKQSMYFLIGLGILVILIVVLAIVLIRQNKLREQQKNLLLQQKLFRSQMNPHFIFNTLVSIQNFILNQEPVRAGKYLSRFSKLVRNILDSSFEEYVPLEEEISTIENYLELQKIRFADKFDFTVEVDEAIDSENTTIPPMLLQPFIENSIEHGFRNKKTRGNISISLSLKNGILVIDLEDDGIGREKAQEILFKQNKDHKSMATTITLERIQVLNKKHKKKITLNIKDLKNDNDEPIGTKVTFEIPTVLH